jgi:HD-GYP domain-containing protein (c-di-GMP phosphodiesterase class II)
MTSSPRTSPASGGAPSLGTNVASFTGRNATQAPAFSCRSSVSVRLVSIDSLDTDTLLARDVYADNLDIPLLRRGVKLTNAYMSALVGKGITRVWIDDALGEDIEPVAAISADTRRRASQAVGDALKEAKAALQSGGRLSESAVSDLSTVATLIAEEVMAHPDAALHLADMMGADQYLMQHVIDVTALGVVLARKTFLDHGWVDHSGKRRFGAVEGRLAKIGLGLLLHDIGKLSIPPEILNKPGKLDDAEWELVRKHPVAGCDMLSEDISFLVRAVVRSHHERWDGRGYPDKLSGDSIHQFARIATIADVYDAVTSERPYKAAAPPYVGVDVITSGSGTSFDPQLVGVFSKVVMPYPPGYEVELYDGRRGVVVDIDPDQPHRPKVRVRNLNGSIDEIEYADLALPTERDDRIAA